MNGSVHILLGANSGSGFYSLYEQLLNGRLDDLLIIKGGPGCGKSSFMRAVARELTAAGHDPIYVHCSGDPDSLDGVLFPQFRLGLVDGTSPHVLEPAYAVASERYLDLSPFYDVDAVKALREEIIEHTKAYRAAYAEAYHILRAADALASERRAVAGEAADYDTLERRLDSFLRRELRNPGSRRGRVDYAFLGGITHQGELLFSETVGALCPRVYAIQDSFGLAGAALERICGQAADAGIDVLACPNPDRPRELQHVLLPAAGAAFVTSTDRAPYPGSVCRRLRADTAVLRRLSPARRAELRLSGRLENALRAEAVEALRRAKSGHDSLEKTYNPCVNFDGVYARAETEARFLLARCRR